MKRFIAIAGAKGSGKDVAGAYFRKRYAAQVVAFADPIKEQINKIFVLDDTNNNQYDLFKRTDLSFTLQGFLSHIVRGRDVVREIGMLMRGYDVDQFTRYVQNAYRHYDGLTVVTDLRFHNEMTMLRRNSAKVIRIDREGHDYDGHVTETKFSDEDVDYIIKNDGSLEDLHNSIDIIMKEMEVR